MPNITVATWTFVLLSGGIFDLILLMLAVVAGKGWSLEYAIRVDKRYLSSHC